MLRAKLVNWWYGFGGGSSAESTVRGRARWVWTPTRQTQTMILSPFASTPFATVKMRRRAGKVHRRTGADLERGKDKWRVAADNGPVEGQQAAAETRYVAKTATQTNDTNDNLTESQQVQRELALRVMEAQTRWIRAPGKSKKKKLPKGDDDAGTHASSSSAASDDVTSAEDAVGTAADTVVGEAWERGRWLLGLLVLQSSSSVVLQHYGDLVRDNLIITLFLTMLVGAGGNAGNQSAIRVIRGLATGDMVVTKECFVDTLWQQARVGFLLATFLSLGGFARVMITEATGGLDGGSVEDAAGVAVAAAGSASDPSAAVGAFGIALSLFCIVTLSTVAGTAMPFALAATGQDPANAGTTIQVFMDVMGVVITCVVCSAVFTQFPEVLTAVGG